MYYQSSMQIETSNPEGKRKMPETRLTSFRHYPLVRKLGFLGLHRRLLTDYFFLHIIGKFVRFILGGMWDLVVSVPDHCLSFYFFITKLLIFPFALLQFTFTTANVTACK